MSGPILFIHLIIFRVCVCETSLHIKSLDGREELYRDGRKALYIIMIISIG
jgi:hypothetical protein